MSETSKIFIFYKIYCKDSNITDFFIGRTKNIIQKGYEHKHDCNNDERKAYYTGLYTYIRSQGGWDNWSIQVIETMKFDTSLEVKKRHQYLVESLDARLNNNYFGRDLKEYHTLYRINHAEELRAKSSKYYYENKAWYKNYFRQYYWKHRDFFLEKNRQYWAKNKHKKLFHYSHPIIVEADKWLLFDEYNEFKNLCNENMRVNKNTFQISIERNRWLIFDD